MAEAPRNIFNKKASEKLRSPDDLEKFIKVTNPGIWVVLLACVALILGLLVWGIFGAVSTSVSTTGTMVEGRAVCFLDAENAAKVHVGDVANVAGESMQVTEVSAVPLSRNEARSVLNSDYLVSTLVEGDWAYAVHFEGDGEYDFTEGVPLSVNITVERVAPISLILGQG